MTTHRQTILAILADGGDLSTVQIMDGIMEREPRTSRSGASSACQDLLRRLEADGVIVRVARRPVSVWRLA